MVIPMKGQFEQQCNAAALNEMGVPVMKSLKKKHLDKLKHWLQSRKRVLVDYPDNTEQIIDKILHTHAPSGTMEALQMGKVYNFKKFRQLTIKKIMA